MRTLQRTISKTATKKLYLIGSGGHCRVIVDAIISNSNEVGLQAIVDINYKNEFELIDEFYVTDIDSIGVDNDIFISIGDNKLRKQYFDMFSDRYIPNIIHPKATLSSKCELGRGIFINVGSIINTRAVIGDNTIINTGAIIEHDCSIGQHSHIAPGVNLAGKVTIGDNCLIGIGTNIIQGINICSDVIVGAGSVVIADIIEPGTYCGSPAKRKL